MDTEKDKGALVAREPALEGEIIPPGSDPGAGKKIARGKTARGEGKGKALSTALQVANAKPAFYSVAGEGLYLKKTGPGPKDGSWVYRYRTGRKNAAGKPERRSMGLGTLAVVDLKQARKLALEAAQKRNAGLDPLDDKREKRRTEKAVPAPIFRQAAESFADRNQDGWKGADARANWICPLVRHAYPVIGDLPVNAVRRSHLIEVLEKAERRVKREGTARARDGRQTMRQLARRIASVIDYVIARTDDDEKVFPHGNPARQVERLKQAIPSLTRKTGEAAPHYPAPETKDVPRVYNKLRAKLRERPVLGAWLMMILCALRPSEALGARWSEIDLVNKLWTIPAARTKRNREHVVPLVPEAIAVLEISAESRSSDMIFPGRSRDKSASHTHFAELPSKLGIRGRRARTAGAASSAASASRPACRRNWPN
jgi:integrase